MKRIFLVIGFLLFSSVGHALDLSRVKVWSSTEILTSSDLNGEFNNILNHSLTNNDIDASAAIVGSKLDLSVPGAIGGTTPGSGAFTTLTASGAFTPTSTMTVTGDVVMNEDVTIGNAIGDALIIDAGAWTLTNNTTWTLTGDLTFSGTIADLGIVTTADINGGTIDGVTIGASSAPTVTDLGSVATADINGGTMDGVQVDSQTATGMLYVNDSSDDLSGLGSQGTTGEFLKSAGSGANPTWADPNFSLVAGSTILLGIGATERTTSPGVGNPSTWTKLKEFDESMLYSGNIEVGIDIKIPGSETMEVQIYINDSPVGSLQSTTSSSYVTKTFSSVAIVVGDTVSAYVRKTTGGSNTLSADEFTASYKNFLESTLTEKSGF